MTAEKQNVAVSVLQFESTQAVIGISKRFGKLHIARQKFCCQRVRIGDMEIGVPPGDALFDVTRVARHWIDADVLEHDHRSSALNNAEEDVVRFGSLKRDVEAETVAVKRQCRWDILDDEEWRNTGDSWFSHSKERFFRMCLEQLLANYSQLVQSTHLLNRHQPLYPEDKTES